MAAGALLANDSDAEGDTLTVVAVDASSIAGGTVAANGTGGWTYTPPSASSAATASATPSPTAGGKCDRYR